MAHPVFGAFIEHDSQLHFKLPGPPKIVTKDAVFPLSSPSQYELDELRWGKRLNGPQPQDSDLITTPTGHDLEQSSSPKRNHEVDAIIQTASNPRMNIWRLLSAAVIYFMMGSSDGAQGALIPYLEADYHVGYAVVALIFVGKALGYLLAAPLVQAVASRWGRSRTYVISTSLITCGYIALVCAPPFPVVIVSFFFLGFGTGLFLALTNSFVVNLVNGTVILGAMHGLYGLGGTISPLIATAMVSRGIRWSYFYFILLVLSLSGVALMGWSYKDYEKDSAVQLLTPPERTASRLAAGLGEPAKGQLLKSSLRNRTTVLGALFIFCYQGAEVSISGWMISFLIHYRNGNPATVGNVTAGFWAGITLGRFVLTHFAHKIGERLATVWLVVGAAACQLLVWLVPNVVGDAVAVSIVGLFLGPVYPCATAVFSRVLPRNIQITSLGFVASLGSAGGAVIPFICGVLSEKMGTVVMNPICIVLFVLMEGTWMFLPRAAKRVE